MPARYPERIVCLTEETTETLYLLGEERRIVGISGYTVRPPQARRDKPRVSAFLSAKTDKILTLKPDLGDRFLRPAGRHRTRFTTVSVATGDRWNAGRSPLDFPHQAGRHRQPLH